eukprot:gene9157-biopygen6712
MDARHSPPVGSRAAQFGSSAPPHSYHRSSSRRRPPAAAVARRVYDENSAAVIRKLRIRSSQNSVFGQARNIT